jgi:hypothetical protein
MKDIPIKNVAWGLAFVLFAASIWSVQSALYFPQFADGTEDGIVTWRSAPGFEWTLKRHLEDKKGGVIHVHATDPANTQRGAALRSRISKSGAGGAVVFDYVADTSLIVVPAIINNHGPYRLLLGHWHD